MTEVSKLLCYFDDISLPYKVKLFLCENYSIEDLVNIETHEKEITSNCGESVFFKLKNANLQEKIEKIAQKLKKYEIKCVSYCDKEYPKSLKNIPDKPLLLYYKGNLDVLKNPCVAIVGTRKPTEYGRQVTKKFSSELSKAGVVIVSGLAYGLDMEAAQSCLDVNGKTVAVLGGGLNKIYPAQNVNLAKRVSENGLLLSEYPPDQSPTKFSFVLRNRLISGLSLGTIIIEAGKGSGTLNTARHTIEQSRELFVVPGNIFSTSCEGSNALIEEMPDTFTISPQNVLDRLKIKNKVKNDEKKNIKIGEQEKLIVNLLYERDLDFDSIQNKTAIDSKTLISLLTRMEISGLIKKLPGNFYGLYVE